MTTPRLCVTVSADDDGRTASRRATGPASSPTWSSCAWTACATSTWRRRSPVVGPRSSSPAGRGVKGARSTDPRTSAWRCFGAAARLGAEYVDVEFDAAFGPLVAERGGRGIVLSSHDFAGVPADLAARFRAMRAVGRRGREDRRHGAHRSATTCRCWSSGARQAPGQAVGARRHGRRRACRAACWAARFGSCWTYAGDGVAPGQLSPERMVSEFRFRAITASTRLFGVVRSAGRALRVAGHAQRRLRRDRFRRRLPAARGQRRRRRGGLRRRDRAGGRQHHGALQGRAARPRPRTIDDSARRVRGGQHAARRSTAAAWFGTPTSPASSSRSTPGASCS